MIVKESEAKEKVCCAALCSSIGKPGRCRGSHCMGWRWAQAPILTRTALIGSGDVEFLTAERQPHSENGMDYALEFDAYMRRALSNDKVNARLIPPHGNAEGWELSEAPGYDEEEGVLYSHQVRTHDPEATGYCGIAGRPYYMGES